MLPKAFSKSACVIPVAGSTAGAGGSPVVGGAGAADAETLAAMPSALSGDAETSLLSVVIVAETSYVPKDLMSLLYS
jgi:hypothetical protein|tara:strand:- start:7550 stop:7780 length:231 start_codon:yes stop_codon:yes gene_type:complete